VANPTSRTTDIPFSAYPQDWSMTGATRKDETSPRTTVDCAVQPSRRRVACGCYDSAEDQFYLVGEHYLEPAPTCDYTHWQPLTSQQSWQCLMEPDGTRLRYTLEQTKYYRTLCAVAAHNPQLNELLRPACLHHQSCGAQDPVEPEVEL